MTEEHVHQAEIVAEPPPGAPLEAHRSFVLPVTLPTAPGQAKTTHAMLEDCSANIVGVRVPGGATVKTFRVGPHAFNMQNGVGVDEQLRDLRPLCPRMSYIYATVRNDTAEMQSFQVEVFLANVDTNAEVPRLGGRNAGRANVPQGSSVAGTNTARSASPRGGRAQPTTVNIPSRPGQVGAIVTSTPGPRRQHAVPTYIPRKSGPKFGPNANRSGLVPQVRGAAPDRKDAKGMNVVAARGWNRRALELVLLHLEKGHLVPSGMVSMVTSYWAPFAVALGEDDAKRLLAAIRTSKRIDTGEAKDMALRIRAAANPSKIPSSEAETEAPPPATQEDIGTAEGTAE